MPHSTFYYNETKPVRHGTIAQNKVLHQESNASRTSTINLRIRRSTLSYTSQRPLQISSLSAAQMKATTRANPTVLLMLSARCPEEKVQKEMRALVQREMERGVIFE